MEAKEDMFVPAFQPSLNIFTQTNTLKKVSKCVVSSLLFVRFVFLRVKSSFLMAMTFSREGIFR